jgi:hypothetical protein
LPYRTPEWSPQWHNRIMMQSQFYAGDSGSVSHKNVDQTKTSRERVSKQFRNVRFVEYVDGAGYFSSLNGDLRKLLAMKDTHSFIQIRSAPVRLRRELQALRFLTPLEIEHALICSSGDETDVGEMLLANGYGTDEVKRGIRSAVTNGIIQKVGSKLSLREDRRDIVRQYLLLDVLAIHGKKVELGTTPPPASILISGYGPFYGMDVSQLANAATASAGSLRDDIDHTTTFTADIKALSQRGFIMLR